MYESNLITKLYTLAFFFFNFNTLAGIFSPNTESDSEMFCEIKKCKFFS